ncbi:hypothetical protein D3C72_1364120 [compost metagenome]
MGDQARRRLRVIRQLEHVAAVGGQRQFEQGAGEAGARLDQREQAARRDVQPRQRPAQHADGLAHEPVAGVGIHQRIGRQHLGGIALGFEDPHADIEVIGAQREDGVVEFARHLERPPLGAGGQDGVEVAGLVGGGCRDRQRGAARGGVDLHAHGVVAVAIGGVLSC